MTEREQNEKAETSNSLAYLKSGYTVRLEAFEGPLDLLLSLIEKRKLHINDISLAKITDDYLEYLKKLEEFPIRDAAHFILIASTLVLIKSRSLLPALSLTDEEEEDIESLERRLILYKRMKELARFIGELFGRNPLFYCEMRREITPVFSPTGEITIPYMHKLMREILVSLPKKEMIPQLVITKVISLEEMIENLIDRVSKNIELSFRDWSGHGKEEKMKVIVGFLAVLELTRRGIITVTQNEHLEEIIMRQSRTD